MIEFFLKRKVFTNILTLFIIIVGGYQAMTVRREAFPEINFDWVTITTLYPGASPEEVEKLVTNNIEKQLKAVDGLDRVQSYSLENRSLIAIRLDEDLSQRDKDRAFDDIQQAVNQTQDLPREAEEPLVKELTSDRPLITLSVAGGTMEERDHFADELADVIEEIPGVSRVEQTGELEKEIWVEADREKLTRFRLTLAEIASTIESHNVDASAGSIESGFEEKWIRVVGAAKTVDDIENIILRGNDAWSFLKVKDVAKVTERYEDSRMITKANGQPSINLGVKKVKSGDTIKLADAVKKVREEFTSRAKEKNIELVVSDDLSFFIKRRLNVMKGNLIQGGVLILIALFIFLDWRLALVAAAGVPISFAAAFAVAVPFGFTINMMTLLALIIVLGMLDDDSVVVAENIYRHMEMGKRPLQAAVEGAKEVILPVLAAVSVSCAGFLPFAMVSGIMGKFLMMIPIIIIVAFIASVIEAFFILPAHVVELMPLGKPVEEDTGGRWYTAILKKYQSLLNWVLSHRGKFMLIVLGFLVSTALLAQWRLKFILFPEGLVEQFFIQLEMPKGSNITETNIAFERVEKAVLKLPKNELDTMTGTVGFKMTSDGSIRYGTQYAQARVFLTPEGSDRRSTKEIINGLRQELTQGNPIGKLAFEELQPGPPVGKAVDLQIRGRDLHEIENIVERTKAELNKMPGVDDIQDTRDAGKDEIHVVLDDREAGFASLDPSRVARNILFAIDGGEASKIRRGTDEIKIKVRLKPDQRANPNELLKLDVLNPQGQPIRLGEVATIQTKPGVPFIEHFNFKSALGVTASVDKVNITSREANKKIKEWFKTVKHQYPGYDMVFGGEDEETAKSMMSLFKAFLFAILLDYVILAAIFSSYLQPFIIILLTVPIGLMGVVYALLLHGKPASFMALLGAVAMTGVVINNAIVLISFMNNKIQEGLSVKDAAIEAGMIRLRPIWASSITTLLGLFPTAYGFGGYEPFVAPMALALAWGLSLAMPMTLFLIPMAFVVSHDMKERASLLLKPLQTKVSNFIRKIAR